MEQEGQEKKETIEGTDGKSPNVKVEAEVAVSKPTEEETGTDAPDAEDIDELLLLLNEIDKAAEGTGEIAEIPEGMRNSLKVITDRIVSLRKVFQDQAFQDVVDDMTEQSEMGEEPSLLVAVARTIPMEDIEKAADEENYSEIQGSIKGKLADDAKAKEDDDALMTNIDQSMDNMISYCKEQNYSPEETEAFEALIKDLMSWFADGIISKEECPKIDKMRNYDRDTEALKSQIPEKPKKEVMPDAASMAAASAPPVQQKSQSPRSAMDGVSSILEPSYLKKKKR